MFKTCQKTVDKTLSSLSFYSLRGISGLLCSDFAPYNHKLFTAIFSKFTGYFGSLFTVSTTPIISNNIYINFINY